MRDDGAVDFGAGGGVVEVDETFIGHDTTIKPKHSKKGRGYAHKHKVLALVDRETGRAKSMVSTFEGQDAGPDPEREHRQGSDGLHG